MHNTLRGSGVGMGGLAFAMRWALGSLTHIGCLIWMSSIEFGYAATGNLEGRARTAEPG